MNATVICVYAVMIVREAMRRAARNDDLVARREAVRLAVHRHDEPARTHRKVFVRAGMDVHQRIAAARPARLQPHVEARDIRVVERA